jgi:hypothetical protein
VTAPRGKIEASLAERGRPAMWATENEAAVLSGVGVETFRSKVKGWEKRGFPQINPENGRRPIPGILAFWRLPSNHSAAITRAVENDDDEDGKITFDGPARRQRQAS